MTTRDDHPFNLIVHRTGKFAKAVAARYILRNTKKPKEAALKAAQVKLNKQRDKLFAALNASQAPALTFAVGDVVEPTAEFLARTKQASVSMRAHRWPTFGFIITESAMSENGILSYTVNRVWQISPSEWRLVYRATADSITALYPKPAKVPTPAMHVHVAEQPPVKPICYGCSYYTDDAVTAYKCRVRGECPAMEPGFEKLIVVPVKLKRKSAGR